LHQLEAGRSEKSEARAGTAARAQPAIRNPPSDIWTETLHSNRNFSPATGKSYEPLTPKHFSFNAPAGACPVCHGLGQKMVFDEGLVAPDPKSRWSRRAVLPRRCGENAWSSLLQKHAARGGRPLSREPGNAVQAIRPTISLMTSSCTVRARRKWNYFWRAGKMSTVTRPLKRIILISNGSITKAKASLP
jgi:excinuclease ABC subunit A